MSSTQLNRATNATVCQYCRVGECIHARPVFTFSIDFSTVALLLLYPLSYFFAIALFGLYIGGSCRDVKSILFFWYTL